MSNNAGAHALLGAALMASAVYAHADNADTPNKTNNPRNLAPGANLLPPPADQHPPLDYTPLGLGGGKVWKSCSNILNAFVTFGT